MWFLFKLCEMELCDVISQYRHWFRNSVWKLAPELQYFLENFSGKINFNHLMNPDILIVKYTL